MTKVIFLIAAALGIWTIFRATDRNRPEESQLNYGLASVLCWIVAICMVVA